MRQEKSSLLRNKGFQSLLASLLCIVLGLLIGYIVLLIINPAGAGEAIRTIVENFLYYPSAAARLRYLGNTLVKTAPLLMCSLSVLFAYVSNRTLVFKSKKRGASAIFREFTLFVSGRLMSMAGDMIIMFLCVSVAMLPGIVAKILSNIFVMIFNYVFSKLIIFRKR